MEHIIITNINDAERKWDSNLAWEVFKHFDAEGNIAHSCEFQRSSISAPFFTGGKLEVYFYTIPPGKTSCPYHYHTANEDVFYIISGQGTLRTPDGDKTIATGDAIVMPANEKGAHKLINNSDAPLVYLEVKTATTPEICVQPDSNKAVLIAPPNLFAKTYKLDNVVDYLKDEF